MPGLVSNTPAAAARQAPTCRKRQIYRRQLFPSTTSTMAESLNEPFFKGSTGRNTRGILRLTILSLIAGSAIASRLFSVIRMLPSLLFDASTIQSEGSQAR
jgi:hypothetical protein